MVFQKIIFNDCYVFENGDIFLDKYKNRDAKKAKIITMYKNFPIKHKDISERFFNEES